jgi:hypothetical protein
MEAIKDGRRWRIGTAADVAWIVRGTRPTAAALTGPVPQLFAAYAAIHALEDTAIEAQERALVEHLVQHSATQPWWLGFLDTGAHDIVFDRVRKVTLYWDWPYVLVEAGPSEALSWRTGHMRNPFGVLPDLFFPADRSWCVSALWDDDWTGVGGSVQLIDALLADPRIQARPAQYGN